MKLKFEYEFLHREEGKFFVGTTARIKVYGGWALISHTGVCSDEEWKASSESMIFIPDPNHEWEIE